MTLQHIDNNTLDDFVKTMFRADPERKDEATSTSDMNSDLYNEVLDHLADCESCRDQVSIITMLQNDGSKLRHQSSLTEDQQQTIYDYIDGRLPSDDAGKVEALIKNCPDATKAALHYQSHVVSMQAQLPRENIVNSDKNVQQATYSTDASKNSFFTDLLAPVSRFFSLRVPMVYAMTATATVFIAVLLLMQTPELQQNQTVIASYQDNPTVQFTAKNKLPGIGFFAQSGNTSRPFEDVRIELISDNTIKISWPEIAGAALYKMRLQVFNQGKKTVLLEKTTQTNHTTFLLPSRPQAESQADVQTAVQVDVQVDVQALNVNKRYEWVLYGNTTDDRTFYASGGFVISKASVGTDSDTDSR